MWVLSTYFSQRVDTLLVGSGKAATAGALGLGAAGSAGGATGGAARG